MTLRSDRRLTRNSRFTRVGAVIALASLAAPQVALASAMQQARPALVIPTARNTKDGVPQVDADKLEQFDKDLDRLRHQIDASEGARDWSALIQLGRIELAQGRYESAAAQFEASRAIAPDGRLRVESGYRWGMTLLMAGRSQLDTLKDLKDARRKEAIERQARSSIRRAADVLNRVQREDPGSLHVAMARVDAWQAVGDMLEVRAALFQLGSINPSIQADEKFDPATLSLLVVVLIAGAYTVKHFDFGLEADRRAQLVIVLDTLAALAATGAGPIGATGAALYFKPGQGDDVSEKTGGAR